MTTILSVATEWYPRKGGISTFNRHLCIHLAKIHKVYCLVPTFSDDEQIDATQHGVYLIKSAGLRAPDQSDLNDYKESLPHHEPIDIMVGHDRITGPAVRDIHRDIYPKAKNILFIHMSPEEIEYHKPEQKDVDHYAKAQERRQFQAELALASSLIVPVGPKLFKEFQTIMAGFPEKPPLFQFNPGLFKNADQINYTPEALIPEALMMGRLEDFSLKGVDIAYKAMVKVYDNWDGTFIKPKMVLRGSPSGSGEALNSLLGKLASSNLVPK